MIDKQDSRYRPGAGAGVDVAAAEKPPPSHGVEGPAWGRLPRRSDAPGCLKVIDPSRPQLGPEPAARGTHPRPIGAGRLAELCPAAQTHRGPVSFTAPAQNLQVRPPRPRAVSTLPLTSQPH